MGGALEPVAFDIETTGLTVEDTVTVAGLALPMGTRLFLDRGGRAVDADALEADLRARAGEHVVLTAHDGERELLAALGAFVAQTVADRDYLLVAYNGDRWREGFDLPFLRTRLARLDADWPFADVPYADLLPVFDRRFQTAVGGDRDVGDLVGVYETVCGGDLSAIDPFADSEAAVTAFETGAFRDLLAHNLADVLRTDRLATVAERYCSKSEFSVKSLTPVAADAGGGSGSGSADGGGGGSGGSRDGRG